MKKIYKSLDELGALHLQLIAVVVAVGIIGFVGGQVYTTQQKRQEAARASAAAEKAKKTASLEVKTETTDEKQAVEVPAPAEEVKPAPAPTPAPTPAPKTETKTTTTTVTKFTIPTTVAQVNADNVVLTAKLDKAYSGTCEAMVKWEDGTNAKWFNETFANADTCSVTVPRDKLAGQTNWKFYMYYYNDPKNITVKGSSSGNLFALN